MTFSLELEPNTENWGERVGKHLESLRRQRPLIYCLTNFVTVNDVANALAATGASPVMSAAPEEAAELISYAGAVLLNPGTLNQEFIRLVQEAMRLAGETGTPCLLDPVGSGATRLRTETFEALLKQKTIQVVRGNLGEIVSLAGITATTRTRGVDSITNSQDESEASQDTEAATATRALQNKWSCGAVSATGKRDTVTDGRWLIRIYNGHEWLPGISGSGCTVGAISAAFLAVADPLEAAVSGLVCYGVAAEIAASKSSGPGTLKVNIFDALFNLTPEQVLERARVKTFQVSHS